MSPVWITVGISITFFAGHALRAGVIVVDAAGGGDHTTLTPAVNAAANGDTILVLSGNYSEPGPVVVDAKGITITGEFHPVLSQLPTTVRPGLIIRNLGPNQHVVLQNLSISGAPSTPSSWATSAVTLTDNVSQVRAQQCWLRGGAGTNKDTPDGASAVEVTTSLSVVLVGSRMEGGAGNFSMNVGIPTGYGGQGLRAADSIVIGYQTLFTGGDGGGAAIGGFGFGGGGGAGIIHLRGLLLLAGTTALGGDGGTSFQGGAGGAGIQVSSLSKTWLMAGAKGFGGNGGWSDSGPDGADGADILGSSGNVVNLGGTAHDFQVHSPSREGHPVTLAFGGQAGDSCLLFLAAERHHIPYQEYHGVLLLAPFGIFGPFAFGSPGNQSVSLATPLLPGGLDVVHLHLQPAYLGSDGAILGPARILTILDSSL